MRTTWSCEFCRATGSIEHPATATLGEICTKILDTHRTARPLCRATAKHIRARLESKTPVSEVIT